MTGWLIAAAIVTAVALTARRRPTRDPLERLYRRPAAATRNRKENRP